jgi:tRNA (guanine-N(7)-)-methyltransferase subunit TRM82
MDDGILNHPAITQLPGNPLDVAIAPGQQPPASSTEESSAEPALPKIVVAVDPGEEIKTKSIHVFALTLGEGRLSVDTDSTVRDDNLEKDEPEITAKEVQDLLYGVENLRKQAHRSDEQGDGPVGTGLAEKSLAMPIEEQS